MELPLSDELYKRFVQPWYLQMMRLGACQSGQRLAPQIARASLDADEEVVLRLLRPAWRERVMGAWLSVTRSSEIVMAEVLHQLEQSHGALDAPPLATAAVVLAGPACTSSLGQYHERDVNSGWGAAEVVRQASHDVAARFGVPNILPAPEHGMGDFAQMLAVAESIRSYAQKYADQQQRGMIPVDIEQVWDRISVHAGETFTQLRGKQFTYAVQGWSLTPDTTNQNLSKATFAVALDRVPLSSTSEVQDLRGPSYLYAILMDERIRQQDW
jgi:hypothetical protein